MQATFVLKERQRERRAFVAAYRAQTQIIEAEQRKLPYALLQKVPRKLLVSRPKINELLATFTPKRIVPLLSKASRLPKRK